MSKVTDPIADYLTRVRNAIMAKHRVVDIPASNLKKETTAYAWFKFEHVKHVTDLIVEKKFEQATELFEKLYGNVNPCPPGIHQSIRNAVATSLNPILHDIE